MLIHSMSMTGEVGHHSLYQQDRQTDVGTEAATSRRILQAPPHCRRNQWLAKVYKLYS